MGLFRKVIDLADTEHQQEMCVVFDLMNEIYDQLLDKGHHPDVIAASMIGVGIDQDVAANGRIEAAANLETMAIMVAATEPGPYWRH